MVRYILVPCRKNVALGYEVILEELGKEKEIKEECCKKAFQTASWTGAEGREQRLQRVHHFCLN